ncbi:MAG: DUF4369 domain-containing protein [Chitinophagaceae bacterium]
MQQYQLLACQPKEHGAFTVSGNIANSPTDKIYLEEIPFAGERPVVIDSTTIKNGKFELRGLAKIEGLYALTIQSRTTNIIGKRCQKHSCKNGCKQIQRI